MAADTVIGIDLDNTLACYDELFHRAACDEMLIDPALPSSKEVIRNAIRLLPNGENQWTRLQAIVYGPKMPDAKLFDGIATFFQSCLAAKTRVQIVSHKTHFAALDGGSVDLRAAALEWLKVKGFFTDFGLSPSDVYFESTRAEKIARIHALRCTHFIDDLPEVFAEDSFPRETEKLLFAPHGTTSMHLDVQVFNSWRTLDHFFFS
jgi:hypothetical protein